MKPPEITPWEYGPMGLGAWDEVTYFLGKEASIALHGRYTAHERTETTGTGPEDQAASA